MHCRAVFREVVHGTSRYRPTRTRSIKGPVRNRPLDVRYVTHYTVEVIRTFRDKGLRRLFMDDDRRGVRADHADKLGRILARLHAARTVSDMDLPGYRLHPLRGELKGFCAVTV